MRDHAEWRLRVLTFALAVTVAMVCAIPQVAKASTWDWCYLWSYSPHGTAKISGTTKLVIRRISGVPESTVIGPKTRFVASNRNTRFYYTSRHWDPHRISRNTYFKKYSGNFNLEIVWKWKRNSKGKRYRYIQKLLAWPPD